MLNKKFIHKLLTGSYLNKHYSNLEKNRLYSIPKKYRTKLDIVKYR